MKVAILGAGLIGTTSAWYLARDGHEVIVVDRQPRAGLETSFANGGQISVSHAEPWANPSAPWQLLKWLDGRNASTFGPMEWNGTTLGFSITASQEASGLVAMVPVMDVFSVAMRVG